LTTTFVLCLGMLLIGHAFGRMDATACRQRVAYMEDLIIRRDETIAQLTRELDEARADEPTVEWS
jgi:hypothetical protein